MTYGQRQTSFRSFYGGGPPSQRYARVRVRVRVRLRVRVRVRVRVTAKRMTIDLYCQRCIDYVDILLGVPPLGGLQSQ